MRIAQSSFIVAAVIVPLTLCWADQAKTERATPDEAAPDSGMLLYGAPVPETTSPPMIPLTGPPLRPVNRPRPAPGAAAAAGVPLGPPPAPEFQAEGPPKLIMTYPPPGAQVNEGEATTIVWDTQGPITQVRLSYHGNNCELGGHDRGIFSETLGKLANTGTYSWKIPWVDAAHFDLRLIGCSAEGKELAATEITLNLRPAVCKDKPAHCIVISKDHQRLYFLHEGRIVRMHIISTAAGGYWTPDMHPGSYDHRRGAMGQVFRKDPCAWSHRYGVPMAFWLAVTSSGSHGIHATSPRFYGRLGEPASHGCIRQHRHDAAILYDLVEEGTPVFVF